MSDYEYSIHVRRPRYWVPLIGLPLYPAKPRPWPFADDDADYEGRLDKWERDCEAIDRTEALMFFGCAGALIGALLGGLIGFVGVYLSVATLTLPRDQSNLVFAGVFFSTIGICTIGGVVICKLTKAWRLPA